MLFIYILLKSRRDVRLSNVKPIYIKKLMVGTGGGGGGHHSYPRSISTGIYKPKAPHKECQYMQAKIGPICIKKKITKKINAGRMSLPSFQTWKFRSKAVADLEGGTGVRAPPFLAQI